jgi:hypothetical protein
VTHVWTPLVTHVWTPLVTQEDFLDRCSAQSGADMCTASDAAHHMPRARMGVRDQVQFKPRALETPRHVLVFLIPSHRLVRHPSPLTFLCPNRLAVARAYAAAAGTR